MKFRQRSCYRPMNNSWTKYKWTYFRWIRGNTMWNNNCSLWINKGGERFTKVEFKKINQWYWALKKQVYEFET
jgi:hypothetical protein